MMLASHPMHVAWGNGNEEGPCAKNTVLSGRMLSIKEFASTSFGNVHQANSEMMLE